MRKEAIDRLFARLSATYGRDFTDAASCLNAGAEEEPWLAELRGQAVAVAAAKVAERCGALELTDEPTTVVLDHDPIEQPWPLLTVEDY